jgi:hypothetical protein
VDRGIAAKKGSSSTPAAIGGTRRGASSITPVPTQPVTQLVGVYHTREIESVTNKIINRNEDEKKLFSERAAKIEALQKSFEELGKLEEFDKQYHILLEGKRNSFVSAIRAICSLTWCCLLQ